MVCKSDGTRHIHQTLQRFLVSIATRKGISKIHVALLLVCCGRLLINPDGSIPTLPVCQDDLDAALDQIITRGIGSAGDPQDKDLPSSDATGLVPTSPLPQKPTPQKPTRLTYLGYGDSVQAMGPNPHAHGGKRSCETTRCYYFFGVLDSPDLLPQGADTAPIDSTPAITTFKAVCQSDLPTLLPAKDRAKLMAAFKRKLSCSSVVASQESCLKSTA